MICTNQTFALTKLSECFVFLLVFLHSEREGGKISSIEGRSGLEDETDLKEA